MVNVLHPASHPLHRYSRQAPLPPIGLLICGVFLFVQQASAQDPGLRRVTLEEAIGLFAENNLELRLSRARTEEMAGLARQAAAYPNPSADLTHEPLWREGDAYSETYLTLTQRVEWPAARRARRVAAAQLAEASRGDLQSDSLRLVFEVARGFAEAGVAEERVAVLESVTDMFREADRASLAMRVEGEVSGYSLRRLRVERARYENSLALARLEVGRARRRLGYLILPDGDRAEIAPKPGSLGVPVSPAQKTVLESALARRGELRAARASMASAKAQLQLALRERIPAPSVTAGVKRQSDEFGGAFLGLSMGVPVFDRKKGTVAAQQARLLAAETQMVLAEHQVESDVRHTYEVFASLTERNALITGGLLADADALLHAARVGYAEGEMSLIELLDAAEAYRDARIFATDLLLGLQIAYFDLLRAAGGALTDHTHSTHDE